VTVTDPCVSPSITSQPAGESLCQNLSATSLTLVATGTASLSYQWYNNSSDSYSGSTSLGSGNDAQTDSLSSSGIPTDSAGTTYFYCVVTNACGADTSIRVAIIINALPNTEITNNTGSTEVTCAVTSIDVTAKGGTSYAWNNGPNTANRNFNSAGKYYVTVTDSNTCMDIDSITITENNTPPVADAGADFTKTCTQNAMGSSIGSNYLSGHTYVWSPSTALSDPNIYNPNADPADTTTYTLTLTNTINACFDTDDVTVNVNTTPPNVIANASKTDICFGDSVKLSGGGAHIYTWDNGVTDGVAFSPADTTAYTVTGTDTLNACTNTAGVTVNVNPLPVSNPGVIGADTICAGDTTQLDANVSGGTSPYTYMWDNTGSLNNNAISQPIANPSSTTTYTLVVTDFVACTASDYIDIIVNAPPSASISGSGTICSGDTSIFTASPNGSGETFQWSTGGSSDSTAYFNSPAIYYVSVTTSFGCEAVGSKALAVNLNPVVNLSGDSAFCTGDSTTITATASNGIPTYSYNWTGGNTSASITLDSTGLYSVTVTDNKSCTVSGSINITEDSVAIANAGNDVTVCNSSSAIINGAIGGAANSLVWATLGNGSFDDTSILNPRYYPDSADKAAGWVFLVLTTDTPTGTCVSASDTMKIDIKAVLDPGSILSTGESIYFGDTPLNLISESLPASGGSGVYDYRWKRDTILLSGNSATFSPSSVLTQISTFTREVDDILMNGLNCATWTTSAGSWEIWIIETHNISGKVLDTLSVLVQNGVVMLLKLNPGAAADTISSVTLNALGEFNFFDIDSGSYLLKIDASNTLINSLPTYFPNTFYWYDANIIEINYDTIGFEISMLQLPLPPQPGPTNLGKIFGKLLEGNAFRGPSEPIDSIVIGMTRPDIDPGAIYMLDTTDNDGYFEFNNLPDGNYALYPDITGIPIDTLGWTDLNITGSDTDSIIFLADSNIIVLEQDSTLTNVIEYIPSLKLWPNPVMDRLFVTMSEPVKAVNIYDSKGALVRLISILTDNRLILSVETLKPGIYILELRYEGKTGLAKFVKQ